MIRIAKYITSIDYLVVCTLLWQVFKVVGTAFIIYMCLPVGIQFEYKIVAACLGSFVIESFLLVVSANNHLIGGTVIIPILFGVFSTTMSLFVLDPFNESDIIVTYKKFFLSLELGLIDYLMSYLFVKKWDEWKAENTKSISLSQLIVSQQEQRETIDKQQDIIQDNDQKINQLETQVLTLSNSNKILETINENLKGRLHRVSPKKKKETINE